MEEHNLEGIEQWREYDFGGRTHRIDDPAPGHHGCVLRWFPYDAENPVAF